MVTQTVVFPMVTGETGSTAKLFNLSSDTPVANGSPQEFTNRKGWYYMDVSDIPAGIYMLVGFGSDNVPLTDSLWVDLLLAAGSYPAYPNPGNTTVFADFRQMIVNDGTVNAQWSGKALENVPASSAEITQDDINAIAAAVRVLPNVQTGQSRTGITIIQSDDIVLNFTVTPGSYSRLVWSLKRKASDPDTDALLTVDSATGITRLNGQEPNNTQAALGTLSYSSGIVTLDVKAEITTLLPVGDNFVDGIKVLPANRHLRNAPASAKVVAGTVQAIE